MAKQTADTITLSIKVRGETHQVRFQPTLADFNKFTNDMSMSDKVVPTVKYLKRVVVDEDKDTLDTLLNIPSMAMNLAGELNELYIGEIEIEVKK